METNEFRIFIFVATLVSIYGFFASSTSTLYETALVSSLIFYHFRFALLILFLLSTVTVNTIYQKNYFMMCRYRNQKEYLKEKMKSILIINIVLFILSLAILLIILNLTSVHGIEILNGLRYSITNVSFLLILVVRYVLILNILSVIQLCLFERIGQKKTMLIFIVWYVIAIYNGFRSRFSLSSYFGYYLFSSLREELICSAAYIMILLLIAFIVYRLAIRVKGSQNEL